MCQITVNFSCEIFSEALYKYIQMNCPRGVTVSYPEHTDYVNARRVVFTINSRVFTQDNWHVRTQGIMKAAVERYNIDNGAGKFQISFLK